VDIDGPDIEWNSRENESAVKPMSAAAALTTQKEGKKENNFK
jgi:hypothetical protein